MHWGQKRFFLKNRPTLTWVFGILSKVPKQSMEKGKSSINDAGITGFLNGTKLTPNHTPYHTSYHTKIKFN